MLYMVGRSVFAANMRSVTARTRNLITLILIVLEARGDYGFNSSVAVNSNSVIFADKRFRGCVVYDKPDGKFLQDRELSAVG